MEDENERNERRIRALEGRIAELRGEVVARPIRKDMQWYEMEEMLRILGSIPRARYCDIVQRQHTAVVNLAKTHGIPLGGDDINIQDVLQWFHGYIGKYGARCNGKADGPDDKDDVTRRKQDLDMQQLELKVKMLQADFERKAGNAISADEVDRLFAWFESELRKLGERLGKRFGSDAQNLFNDTLSRIGKHLEELMPTQNQPGEGNKGDGIGFESTPIPG